MTLNLTATIFAIALAAHGVGHMLFLVPLLGLASWPQSTESWLFSKIGGCKAEMAAGTLLWGSATLAFLGAAVGLFFSAVWWTTAALIGVWVSIAGLILFIKFPPSSPAIWAFLFDIFILILLDLDLGGQPHFAFYYSLMGYY